jgi:hypothetical protein
VNINPDGTMNVKIDGKLERRTFSVERIPGITGPMTQKPDLYPGEHLIECIGDIIPTIIRMPV